MFKLIFFLLAIPAYSQVIVTVSPTTKVASSRILSGRFLKSAMMWIVSLDNQSDGPVSIGESAVLRRIPQLMPFDHQSLTLLVAEAAANSPLARGGRVVVDLTTLGAFIGSSLRTSTNQPRWGPAAMLGLTALPALAPYVIQRFKGVDPPVQRNFESLAWTGITTLQTGESATEHVFTAVWANPQPVTFIMETSKLQPAKVLQ